MKCKNKRSWNNDSFWREGFKEGTKVLRTWWHCHFWSKRWLHGCVQNWAKINIHGLLTLLYVGFTSVMKVI